MTALDARLTKAMLEPSPYVLGLEPSAGNQSLGLQPGAKSSPSSDR